MVTCFSRSYIARTEPWEYAGRRNIMHCKVIDVELVDETTTAVGVIDESVNEERVFVIKDSELGFDFSKFMQTRFDKEKDKIQFFMQKDVADELLPWNIIGFMTELGHEGGKLNFTN